MPLTKSAIKKARQDVKKRYSNRTLRSRLKNTTKKFIASATEENFKLAQSAIDRAVKKNLYKKNTAARIKSRLAKLVKIKTKKEAALKKEKTVGKKTKVKSGKAKS